MLKYYQDLLKSLTDYSFLKDYLKDPLLKRLKQVGYFCGMDYASKDIYNFSEYISRYDHSLNVALLTYYLTKDEVQSIAGLYHDVATPCFSHVIDYMNKDYLKQESTELLTKDLLINDDFLIKRINNLDDISNFKQYSVVDNERPKLCADRLDAVILNSYGWIRNLDKSDISNIIQDIYLETNEDNEKEIAFKSYDVAKRVKDLNDSINKAMHSKEDIYMMQLLADIVKEAISNNIVTYEELYLKTEVSILNILSSSNIDSINEKMNLFYTISKKSVPNNDTVVKDRILSPLVRKKRI